MDRHGKASNSKQKQANTGKHKQQQANTGSAEGGGLRMGEVRKRCKHDANNEKRNTSNYMKKNYRRKRWQHTFPQPPTVDRNVLLYISHLTGVAHMPGHPRLTLVPGQPRRILVPGQRRLWCMLMPSMHTAGTSHPSSGCLHRTEGNHGTCYRTRAGGGATGQPRGSSSSPPATLRSGKE